MCTGQNDQTELYINVLKSFIEQRHKKFKNGRSGNVCDDTGSSGASQVSTRLKLAKS